MDPVERVKRHIDSRQYPEALAVLKEIDTEQHRFWAIVMSGKIYRELGQLSESASCFEAALSLNPGDIEANLLMGLVNYEQGNNDAALPFLMDVYRCDNNNYPAIRLLALLFLNAKQFNEAVKYTHVLSATWKDNPEASLLHGQALVGAGKPSEALECFARVIALSGQRYEGYYCKAGVLSGLGRVDEAISYYQLACKWCGNVITPPLDLAALYEKIRKPREAILIYQALLTRYPEDVSVINRMASLLIKLYRSDEAIDLLKKSISLDDNQANAYAILANAYKSIGMAERCIAYTKKAFALNKANPSLYSSYLLDLNYLISVTNEKFLEEHKKWDDLFSGSINQCDHAGHDKSAGRKLRIGYLSADFKNHAVYYFIEPILANHDKEHFEIFCYYNDVLHDEVTERFISYADTWRNIHALSDEQASRLIFNDNIDILVDLSGHTAGNRLAVVASKPAPVVVEYEAYPNTTGLSAIDYKFTDRLIDTKSDQQWHTEKLYSLGECFICYQPNRDAPEIQEPPFSRNGYITFGSFSNLYKINEDVILLWSQLLCMVPRSRLLIFRLSINQQAIDRISKMFSKHGVDSSCYSFVGKISEKYNSLPEGTGCMAMMSECDFILDTFPYCNHTIACEALWMGIPIVTLYGDRHASRVCATILNAIGHTEMIAYSKDQYIHKVTELCDDLDRITELRSLLREDFRKSPLMDFVSFTRKIEFAYNDIWRNYQEHGAEIAQPG